MVTIKKEVVHTMPYTTEQYIRKANSKRQKLYDKYESVQVYPNGMYEVKIVCTNQSI